MPRSPSRASPRQLRPMPHPRRPPRPRPSPHCPCPRCRPPHPLRSCVGRRCAAQMNRAPEAPPSAARGQTRRGGAARARPPSPRRCLD
eukprot:335114-Prymnesium_polylepis.1